MAEAIEKLHGARRHARLLSGGVRLFGEEARGSRVRAIGLGDNRVSRRDSRRERSRVT